MGFIVDSLFGGGGDDAADASIEAANIDAAGQREALDYLKETEAIPQQFREGALQRLGGLYGLEGGVGDELEQWDQPSQKQLMYQAKRSPLYSNIMGGRKAGEESIARHAGMTGGLRSGDIQSAFYDYNTQLQNQALLQSYNQLYNQSLNEYNMFQNESNQQLSGLQGLAQLPSNANQISQGMIGIGQTQAFGVTAAEQARQTASQQSTSNLMGMAKLGLQAYSSGLFSDIRLKENIHYISEQNGHSWFSWDWNETAKELGLEGSEEGVMAHLVYEYMPEAIGTYEGFVVVNQDMILQESA